MVQVKICGITRQEDLQVAIATGADALGFVVGVPSSPRNLHLLKARSLISQVPGSVSTVVVTVFKDMKKLKEICIELNADYLQVHGPFQYFLESIVETASEKRVIGAVTAGAEDAVELAGKYSSICDSILVDTVGEGGFGGTGITHNWDLSRRIRNRIHPTPLILAGGLTPENVGEAIGVVKPFGVDVSSGVERLPGIKDHGKMDEFVTQVRKVT
ncbi:MAG: phosphoribosylanthranilate isomerase [Desulfobacterales bacterium]|nr:phosphoribosylanthranilate isomerase [Desulfobacterales bacterium]